jgi:hypothetical protein
MSHVESPRRALFVGVACFGYVVTAACVIFWEFTDPNFWSGPTVLGLQAHSFWTVVGCCAATVSLVATAAALVAKPTAGDHPPS